MTLRGTDLSSYQRGINIAKLGVDFIISKATGGTGYVNPYCDGFIQQAKKAGVLTGVYHFAHESGGTASATVEANHFVDNIKGYVGSSVLALDLEATNLINHSSCVAWAHEWLNRVHERTGVKPLLYMPGWVYNAYDWSPVAKDDYGVWVAYWPTRPSGFNYGSPEKLKYWSFTACWQFTDSGILPGWAGKLDLDVFFGDRAAWAAYAAVGGAKPAPAPVPAPKPAPAPAPKPKPKPAPKPKPVPAGHFRVEAGSHKGKVYESPKTVSAKWINVSRKNGKFSRHTWFLQHWLNMAGYKYGTPTGFFDAETQKLYNEFRRDAGYKGTDAQGAVGVGSLNKLRTKAKASKKVSA